MKAWEFMVSYLTLGKPYMTAEQFREGKAQMEIVQSLAKWKRLALRDYGFEMGEGLYTDMNAIRPDETIDELHSIYVDQWDWERVITPLPSVETDGGTDTTEAAGGGGDDEIIVGVSWNNFNEPRWANFDEPAIIEAVARYHNLRSSDITGKKRTRVLTRPRHIAMYSRARLDTLTDMCRLPFNISQLEYSGHDQYVFRVVAAAEDDAPRV